MNLNTTLTIEELASTRNIALLLDEEDLAKIGSQVVKDFETDLMSRESWEKRTEASMKLALQVAEAKNFPWPNASNIKFPLVTIAALQYHARSYPVLINGDTPVKCRVIGEDKDGTKVARADRIETHMSYQILEQDEDWESEMDKVLITQPIIGCAFKKSYYDSIKGYNVSENVLAKDLVVNYWAKSLETAPRISHLLYFSKNDIYERVARGMWLEIGDEKPSFSSTNLSAARDKAQGTTAPDTNDDSTPYEIIEQHRSIDFDGDGYEEPYIVFVRKDTKQVARIAPRFFIRNVEFNKNKEILSIKAEQYFTKYPFIPSPDGGFYDLGFGVLLGPLNESINTIINQLVDAGTMANTAGGFLSRGIKLRGGNYSFSPLEWKHVDTTGDDLRKGIVPLPVREPSQVLFTLLSLLINYGERVGGAVDILQGQNPGQNTPAETTRTMAEQGMKIFNGIFKRTYRSLKGEFRKLYRLNQLYLDEEVEFVTDSNSKGFIMAQDYQGDSSDVRPSADPNLTSDSQRLMQAHALKEAAVSTPGYNRYEVEKKFLQAMRIPDIEKVFPDPKGPNAVPPPTNPKIQIEQIKAQTKQADQQLQLKLGLMKLMKEAELNQAKIVKLEAEAMALMAEADNEKNMTRIHELNAAISASKERREGTLAAVETMMKVFEAMKPDEQPEAPQPAQ